MHMTKASVAHKQLSALKQQVFHRPWVLPPQSNAILILPQHFDNHRVTLLLFVGLYLQPACLAQFDQGQPHDLPKNHSRHGLFRVQTC